VWSFHFLCEPLRCSRFMWNTQIYTIRLPTYWLFKKWLKMWLKKEQNQSDLYHTYEPSRWNDFRLFIWIIDWPVIYALFLDIVPLICLPRSTIFEQRYCQQTTQYNPFFENCTGRRACKRFTRFQQTFCSSFQLHIVFMYEKMCEEHSKRLNVSTKWAENSLKD
jgi:hypothetical protein